MTHHQLDRFRVVQTPRTRRWQRTAKALYKVRDRRRVNRMDFGQFVVHLKHHLVQATEEAYGCDERSDLLVVMAKGGAECGTENTEEYGKLELRDIAIDVFAVLEDPSQTPCGDAS